MLNTCYTLPLILLFFEIISSIKAKPLSSETLSGNRQPNREDIVNIVHRMYEKDGISRAQVVDIVNTFPNQGKQLFSCIFGSYKFWLIEFR